MGKTERTRKARLLQRQRINEYKDKKCCNVCGEDRNWVLDFHHPDPKNKKFSISQGEMYGWRKLKQEMDKCILLCSNCHRDLHYHENKNNE
jgi:hypothetical protein